MPEEKKSEVTEEVKEEVRKLTETELEQVTGGLVPDFTNEPDLEPADVESSVLEPPVTTDRTAQ